MDNIGLVYMGVGIAFLALTYLYSKEKKGFVVSFFVISYATFFFTLIDILLHFELKEFSLSVFLLGIVWIIIKSFTAHKLVYQENNAEGVTVSSNILVLFTFSLYLIFSGIKYL